MGDLYVVHLFPLCLCHSGTQEIRSGVVYEKVEDIDVLFHPRSLRGEVFMGVGLWDEICPPSTQFAAYNKIVSEKSLAIYPDYGHEFLPGHSDVIYQFMAGL